MTDVWFSQLAEWRAPDPAPPPPVPPTIDLTTPTEGATVEGERVAVAGVATPNASIEVNGYLLAVAENGSFAFDLPVLPGPLRLTVVVRSNGGVAQSTLNITVDDPKALIRANLPRLSAASRELDEARLQLTASREALDATIVERDAAQAGAAAREAEVAVARQLESAANSMVWVSGAAAVAALIAVAVESWRRWGRAQPPQGGG
jgi:hypothetical protein